MKNRNSHSIPTLLLVIAMVLGFCACGGKAASAAPSATEAPERSVSTSEPTPEPTPEPIDGELLADDDGDGDDEDSEAVLLENKGHKTPQINIYARLTTDGQWHNYPGTRHFTIEMATGTSGNIYISGDEITMGTYQLTGSSIIITIGNSVYTFKKTEGIVVNISAAPAH